MAIAQEAGLFPMIYPNDFDKVVREMNSYIKAKYSGIDWLNPDLYRKLGATWGSVLNPWLEHYIRISRIYRQYLIPMTWDFYRNQFADQGYKPEDLDDYLEAFYATWQAGLVPEGIYKPYLEEKVYTGDVHQITADIANFSGKSFNKILLLAGGIAIVYLALPYLIRGKK